ncbi:MAG: hypothetical protein LBN29_12425 [Mediterranea sp.]|nr:hypothetical protein [Mediterranea sp.]
MKKIFVYRAIVFVQILLWGYSCTSESRAFVVLGQVRVNNNVTLEVLSARANATPIDSLQIRRIENDSCVYMLKWMDTHGRDYYLRSYKLEGDSLRIVLRDANDPECRDTVRVIISDILYEIK